MIKNDAVVYQNNGMPGIPTQNSNTNNKNQNNEEVFSPDRELGENRPYDSDFQGVADIYEILGEEQIPQAHEETDTTAQDDKKYHVNGEIEHFNQGRMGDCWCLSAINSLGSCESGKEIIKNAISENEDGSFSVNFKGADTTYTITQEEMEAARNSGKYSHGDNDVLLLELATEKALCDIRDGNITLPDDAPNVIDKYDTDGSGTSPLRGGWPRDLLYLLTGENAKKTSTAYGEEKFFSAIDDMIKTLSENPNTWVTVAFRPTQNPNTGEPVKTKGGYPGLMDVDGNVTLATDNQNPHAWSVVGSDGKTVTLVNPWDSGKGVTVTIDALKQYVYDVEYFEFPKPEVEASNIEDIVLADSIGYV